MSARSFEFWFDFSCPYAYLASRVIEEVCARAGAHLVLAPMLLGGVFRATGAGEESGAHIPFDSPGPSDTLRPVSAPRGPAPWRS